MSHPYVDINFLSHTNSSGAAGLGLQTTIYLSRLGCKVYVASRNRTKSLSGIASAKSALEGLPNAGPILFHQLDLASIRAAKKSAEEFLKLEERLDIVICNAGISMMSLAELSEDGYERLFATNHLGHFAFVTGLLGEHAALFFCHILILVRKGSMHRSKSMDRVGGAYLEGIRRCENRSHQLHGLPSVFRHRLQSSYGGCAERSVTALASSGGVQTLW